MKLRSLRSILLLALALAFLPGMLRAQATPPPPVAGEAVQAPSPETFANELLLGLVVILIGAKIGGDVLERFGQPAVLGEIVFGIVAGNLALFGFHGMDFLKSNQGILALSQIGVILLLFDVGLQSNVGEMYRVGPSAFLVAVLGVTASLLLGWGAALLFLPGQPMLTHIFVGATFSATSVGITARVLRDLNQLNRPESRIVLGAAVIDDVIGLVVLAVVTGVAAAASGGGQLGSAGVLLIVAKALLFLVASLWLGTHLSPRIFQLASYLQVQHMLLATSLAFCFLLALLAAMMGMAPIVGAFAAGLILEQVHYQDFRDRGDHTIEELINPISGFLVPVFFVLIGTNVDLRAAANPGILMFAGVLSLAAIAGKQFCSLGVLQRGLNRLAVGIGMLPRGEVSLIFANMGLTLKVPGPGGALRPLIDSGVFSATVLVVLVTTLITPPLLKWALLRSAEPAAEPAPASNAP